jgi:hypothetical protein
MATHLNDLPKTRANLFYKHIKMREEANCERCAGELGQVH